MPRYRQTNLVGPTGPTGPIGPAGAPGPTGATGSQGLAGDTGPTGATGLTGAAGANGANGAQGSIGPTGAQGSPGVVYQVDVSNIQEWTTSWVPVDTGMDNIVHYQGELYRYTGALPAPAPTLPPNAPLAPFEPVGKLGEVGPPGPAGPTGPTGAVGPAGIKGVTGPTGLAGSRGPRGPQGPIGPTGPTGSDAMDFASFAIWEPSFATDPANPILQNSIVYMPAGVQFANQNTGNLYVANVDHPLGTPGISVDYRLLFDYPLNGPTGPTGATGLPGPGGGVGPAGPVGVTGATGATGSTGATGAAGVNGTNGLRGATGATGMTGATGAAGFDYTEPILWENAELLDPIPAGTFVVRNNIIYLAVNSISKPGGGYIPPENDPVNWSAVIGIAPPGYPGVTGSTGPQGASIVGATGDDGDRGDPGTAGATGPAGAGGLSLANTLKWGTKPEYDKGDLVAFEGQLYLVKEDGVYVDPNTQDWQRFYDRLVPAGGTGPIGVTGPTGRIGPIGQTGAAGERGGTGATGVVGAVGSMGITGPQGPTGAKGERGDTGQQGAQGIIGLPGIVGATGATGPVGGMGAVGLTGLTGRIGDHFPSTAQLYSTVTLSNFNSGILTFPNLGTTSIAEIWGYDYELYLNPANATQAQGFRVLTPGFYQVTVTFTSTSGGEGRYEIGKLVGGVAVLFDDTYQRSTYTSQVTRMVQITEADFAPDPPVIICQRMSGSVNTPYAGLLITKQKLLGR